MADEKISAMPLDATPGTDALVPVVTDPGGTPTNAHTTIADIVAYAAGGGGGLVFLQAYAPSGAASVDITSVFSATYDTYVIDVVGMAPSSDDVTARLLLSTDNGSSWSATTYHWSAAGYPTGSGTAVAVFDDAGTSFLVGGSYTGALIGNTAAYNWSCTIKLKSVNSASIYKTIKWEGVYVGNGTNASGIQEAGGGGWYTTTAVNAAQLKFSSGNMTGNVVVYGMQKS